MYRPSWANFLRGAGNDCPCATMATYVTSYLFCDVSCPEVSNSYLLCSFGGKPVHNSRSTCLRRSQSRRLCFKDRRVYMCQCVQLVHVKPCMLKRGSCILMHVLVLCIAVTMVTMVVGSYRAIHMYVRGYNLIPHNPSPNGLLHLLPTCSSEMMEWCTSSFCSPRKW